MLQKSFFLFQIVIIDLRTVSFDVPKQEVLTKDSVTVYVDAVVYYNIQKPLDAVCKVENFDKSTRLLAATTLRTILGTKNLTELLSDRESISKAICGQIEGPTDRWGIEVGDLFRLLFFIFYLKVSKSQKHFFLKLHCPKSDRSFLKHFCPSF